MGMMRRRARTRARAARRRAASTASMASMASGRRRPARRRAAAIVRDLAWRGSGADGADEGGGCCVCCGVAAEEGPECFVDERGGFGCDAAMCRDAEHLEDPLDGLFGLGGLVGVGCVVHATVDRGGDGTSEVRRRRHEELRTSKDSCLSTLSSLSALSTLSTEKCSE